MNSIQLMTKNSLNVLNAPKILQFGMDILVFLALQAQLTIKTWFVAPIALTLWSITKQLTLAILLHDSFKVYLFYSIDTFNNNMMFKLKKIFDTISEKNSIDFTCLTLRLCNKNIVDSKPQ